MGHIRDSDHELTHRKKIVDEDSGIIGFPEERIVPMHGCDHRTICRFEAETSNGYKSILGVLQDWADAAKEGQS
jgi:hypothetical protein